MSTAVSKRTDHVPEPVARVSELMSGYGSTWALCGGWAVDAWLGNQTRDHGDVDISIFHDDQRAIFDHLEGWQLIAHDPNVPGDTSEPWDGRRPLELPAHIHGRQDDARLPERMDDPGKQGFGLDIQIDERAGGEWIVKDEPRITAPLDECIRLSGWGVPTLTPEVLLFYKAGELRLRDKLDFRALRPGLTDEQRSWLRNAIVQAGHPWLAWL